METEREPGAALSVFYRAANNDKKQKLMIDKIHFDGIFFSCTKEQSSRNKFLFYLPNWGGLPNNILNFQFALLKSFVLLLKFLFSFRIERN